jgi:hypothetical protein
MGNVIMAIAARGRGFSDGEINSMVTAHVSPVVIPQIRTPWTHMKRFFPLMRIDSHLAFFF